MTRLTGDPRTALSNIGMQLSFSQSLPRNGKIVCDFVIEFDIFNGLDIDLLTM